MGKYEALKDALKLAQKADNLDLYRQLLEVQRESQELYEETLELRSALQEREAEIKRLQERIQVAGTVIPEGNLYYTEDEDGHRDGPFCTRCWDADDLLIRVHQHSHDRFKCPECTVRKSVGSQDR